MKTSIATVSVSGELPEKLAAIARAGFDGVEIFDADFISTAYSPRDVGKMVRDAGLELTLFQPFRDFEGLPEPFRTQAFERAERKFDVMGELGADLMLVCSSLSPHALPGLERAAADFRELGERAAKRGLRVGYEALAWAPLIHDHRDAWEIVRRADHPAVGLILDSFHTLSRGIPVESIASIPKEKLFIVQLADAPKLQLDYLSWSRHFRNMPGQGDLDVLGFMRNVQATGYDGVISLEIFNDQFRSGSARSVAVDGKRSLIYLMDQLRAGKTAASATVAQPVALPPKAEVKGVEFIEFAVSKADATELESLLRALGFHIAGRHRSKDVALWRQGGVNLVLNKDPEGFAHSFYINHGPSVCAVGLAVDDAKAVAKRAESLMAEPFMQAVVQGELEIPAIRGIGGSLIYFIDDKSNLKDLWSVDFHAEPEAAGQGAMVRQIDHMSYSTEYDEMLSWILFFTSIFNVDKLPGQDIADPVGLIRSQVVQTTDGALRLALNGAQSMRTLAGRFIEEFFGSGMQHLALATADIFAAGRRIKANGLDLLPIPKNYYDDLVARFQLSPALIEQMSECGIMYDRDEVGEYFQLYTKTFDDRFFFEIVQRHNYSGFGAPNAPVRLAAQTRFARNLAVPKH
ncbi:sugar phosphate isomerase/epimerase and 4-hydroxyphenylpyruvate domain-containing protein [Rhodoblastus sp.]|jgi:4-hydroxyphenylpyruvate dioxygenase|uniref:bifunctional sugar phosphate isomerase/epimerase/4-hydroxyphenylpyruvate dioxygenase family protein n=1 Tax=Rhodoblastus sp. TaxID=1962975 RepID=UPI0025E08E33|nr:sugar phosphate isomerase/epimerase and 4-hydroxyphenylpyruvate domain-containing protein [Rhodoblastus sp.]